MRRQTFLTTHRSHTRPPGLPVGGPIRLVSGSSSNDVTDGDGEGVITPHFGALYIGWSVLSDLSEGLAETIDSVSEKSGLPTMLSGRCMCTVA